MLFIEPPPSLRLPRRGVRPENGIHVAQVAPVLNTRQASLQRLLSTRAVRGAASVLARRQVGDAVSARWLDATAARPVVVASDVFLVAAGAALHPLRLVLDVCDDPRAFPGAPPWTDEVFRGAVRMADIVTTSSQTLYEEIRGLRRSASVYYIPNGVRAELLRFQPVDKSSRGKIGYLGYIGPWLDLPLIDELAAALPDRPVELTGPVDPSMAAPLSRLSTRANVCIKPAVAENEVGRVLAGLAVGIIPFRESPLTRAVNPNKLYEYAALDLPIVTTAFSPDVVGFDSCVDVCRSTPEFVATVRARCDGIGLRSTRWIAETHTWASIAQRFAALLTEEGC
ncbi:MAG: hypothetical protein JOZ81_15640 [Chloroflexi bacterium]|nr:hypothetical protein [Chloroflexota bacterium]